MFRLHFSFISRVFVLNKLILVSNDIYLLFSEIRCPAFITNGELPSTCGTNIGDSCGSFNCSRGYQKQESSPLTCDATGAWTSNITQFCTGLYFATLQK